MEHDSGNAQIHLMQAVYTKRAPHFQIAMKKSLLSALCVAAMVITATIAPRVIESQSAIGPLLAPSPVQAQSAPDDALIPMTVERLDTILRENAESLEIDIEFENGQWRLTQGDRSILVLVNEEFDRMRIVAPITSVENLTLVQQQNMLLANFHTALDARYAISNGLIVSAFIHPLSSLQERDLQSALSQVASLAATFGTTYSSGDLLLAPNGSTQPDGDAERGGLSI
ncbi:MAG: hypothetical protein AAGA75_07015 [Cyanobacteria bacterium P01_E01_bin.6]